MTQTNKTSRKRKLRRIFLALILAVLLGAIAFFCWQYYSAETNDETAENSEQTAQMESARPDETADGDYLKDALAVNAQTVAWLTISDTDIDFPIVQGDDNSYYLDHGFDGSYYGRGCPFLDYRCSSDFTDFNSIIYGHNIQNTYVFGSLLKFRTQSYFDSHATGTLILPDEIVTIQWIACAVVENDSFIYSVVHPAESDRLLYLEQVQECAVASAELTPEDLVNRRLVVLSTCSSDYEMARTVLIGVLEE